MERRASERIRRRMPCSFEYDGHAHKGMVVDVSSGGLFLQTDHAIPLGSELTLRLYHRSGELELRGRVARRRFTPTVIASLIRRGVGIQILSAPESYRDVLHAAEPQPNAAWSALSDLEPPFEPAAPQGLVSLDVVIAAEPPQPPPMVVLPLAAEPSEGLVEEAAAEPAFEPWDEPDRAEAARERLARRLAEDEPELEEVPVLEPAWAPESRIRADALLLHDGELADVERLLEALDATLVRQAAVEAGHFAGWERPPRLIVASGRTALRLSMGTNLEAQGVVAIAVVDSESQTLCGMLRRQGFRYVVRRPVHPEALRLLLGRALFRGRERRDAARVALGCEVGLRLGLRRRAATLLELSRTGCRMLASEWLEPGDHLSLRIPSTATGNRSLQLGGRVLRSERPARPCGRPDIAVALRFDRLDGATRMRLEALIAAHTLGPLPLERSARAPGASQPERVDSVSPAQDAERRRGARVSHREEVVALDPELARVRHTLLGIDLSSGGIRVEPHPDLAIGDRLRIAIYDAGSSAALVLDAEAARDEGPHGVVLRFRNVSEEVEAQIERITGRAPQIESAGAAEGSGVVVAEMLAHQPA